VAADAVEVVRAGPCATVWLNRPEVRNALSHEMVAGLHRAVDDIAAAPPGAVVLAGAGGRAFCAGVDLALVRAALDGDFAAELGGLVDALHRFVLRLRAVPCPVIAAVEGPAVGAGMGLALAADLRVVGRSALLVPGWFGIGATPDGGSSYLLARSVGAARATAAVLRNRPLDAATLSAWGLADEVVDDGNAVTAAVDLGAAVASAPPVALVNLRRLMDTATTNDLARQLEAEQASVMALWQTTDFREGVTAFLERRPPAFTGR
jgi:2-(1,2-epoxy-1,2-dihydrophenyl)acetyl-CoA isomerase